jgi:phosphoribosylanthranilate isomerase
LEGAARVHNWQISRRIRDIVGKPVWLTVGLNPQNIAEVIGAAEPFGIDVCSGVRTDSKLVGKNCKVFSLCWIKFSSACAGGVKSPGLLKTAPYE